MPATRDAAELLKQKQRQLEGVYRAYQILGTVKQIFWYPPTRCPDCKHPSFRAVAWYRPNWNPERPAESLDGNSHPQILDGECEWCGYSIWLWLCKQDPTLPKRLFLFPLSVKEKTECIRCRTNTCFEVMREHTVIASECLNPGCHALTLPKAVQKERIAMINAVYEQTRLIKLEITALEHILGITTKKASP